MCLLVIGMKDDIEKKDVSMKKGVVKKKGIEIMITAEEYEICRPFHHQGGVLDQLLSCKTQNNRQFWKFNDKVEIKDFLAQLNDQTRVTKQILYNSFSLLYHTLNFQY